MEHYCIYQNRRSYFSVPWRIIDNGDGTCRNFFTVLPVSAG